MKSCLPSFEFDFSPGIGAPSGTLLRRTKASTGDNPRKTNYRFNDDRFIGPLRWIMQRSTNINALPPAIADALDIATAVYLADRCAPRAVDASRGWNREIVVRIPIRQARLLEDRNARTLLEEFLDHLTDDSWTIEFVPRTRPQRASELMRPLFNRAELPVTVILHSGGLDSFISIVQAMRRPEAKRVVPVSVATHDRTASIQHSVISALRSCVNSEISPVGIEIGLVGRNWGDRESSQRARSFLYLIAGATAAALCNTPQLDVCENGIGAINLPYSPDQIGAQNTRAMHPVTLALFSQLTDTLFGTHVKVHNSGLWLTKAELLRRFVEDDVIDAARLTVSCDRLPWLSTGKACGICTSCIYRRASLHAAGLSTIDDGINASRGAPKTHYEFDVTSAGAEWARHNLIPLSAFEYQVGAIVDALSSANTDAFPALANQFPAIIRILESQRFLHVSNHEIKERLVRLYSQHAAEMQGFQRMIARPRITKLTARRDNYSAVAS